MGDDNVSVIYFLASMIWDESVLWKC